MAWCGDFIQNELGNSWTDRSTATVVQFSGIKALESSYEPDNDGSAFADDSYPELMHYRIEHGPSAVSSSDNSEKLIFYELIQITDANRRDAVADKLRNVDSLDGNSQIFLALQDMSSEKFVDRLLSALPAGKFIFWTVMSDSGGAYAVKRMREW